MPPASELREIVSRSAPRNHSQVTSRTAASTDGTSTSFRQVIRAGSRAVAEAAEASRPVPSASSDPPVPPVLLVPPVPPVPPDL
ncbi:hypothetical protein Sm713_21350 [Streptomyces sp. TS71-3]|nr:hypothetical protein Sm713_21350 [Streptomyces sp. TS71-3]